MKLIELVFGKKNNVRVLRHLSRHKDWQFNITELSKDIGINKGVLSRLVSGLEKENVIKVSAKGKIKLFSINKENLFVREVIMPLFDKEESFYCNALGSLVQKVKKEAVSVIAYGSAVSGEARLTSDIDVLVVASKKGRAIEERISMVKKEFLENDLLLRVDIVTPAELKRLYAAKEPFIKSVIKNHRVIYGKALMEVLS